MGFAIGFGAGVAFCWVTFLMVCLAYEEYQKDELIDDMENQKRIGKSY